MLNRENLSRHVRDALAHFYDPAFLQTSPLTMLLPQDSEDAISIRLQELLREGLEQLRPKPTIPPKRCEWFPYHILQYRYLQLRHLQTICDELALSTASLYRYQQQAIEALADILWHHYAQMPPASSSQPASDTLSPDEQAVQEAVRLARAAQQEPVDLIGLLENVRQTFASLAQQQDLPFTLDYPATLPTVYADAAILHQIMVGLLTGVLDAGVVGALHLAVNAEENDLGTKIAGRLTGLSEKAATPDLLDRPALVLSRELLAVYGGHLEIERRRDWEPALRFTLPCGRQHTILVIDDHEDTLRLYQRYLQPHGYALRLARSGEDAWQFLTEESLPGLIILDVLMPREDGWMILQRLKILPETAHIPVIIYSVLSQPSLALSLGAITVLRKPVEEDALLRAVNAVFGE